MRKAKCFELFTFSLFQGLVFRFKLIEDGSEVKEFGVFSAIFYMEGQGNHIEWIAVDCFVISLHVVE